MSLEDDIFSFICHSMESERKTKSQRHALVEVIHFDFKKIFILFS